MDAELFRWVLLGLLGLGIVVLIALLATLGGIRKALDQRQGSAGGPAVTHGATGARAQAPNEDDRTTPEVGSAPPEGRDLQTATAGPATEEAGAASEGRADTIRSVLQQHGLSESAGAAAAGQDPAQAVASQPAAAESEQERVVTDSAFAAHADDPQEEPFQREGRWWFRRGDELLLYDEATGQWQPAPEASAATAPPAAQEEVAGSEAAQPGVRTTPVTETPPVADQVSTFWKCPTCGAVNGSTAATCRMCFAARP